jgi:hypothetical protein
MARILNISYPQEEIYHQENEDFEKRSDFNSDEHHNKEWQELLKKLDNPTDEDEDYLHEKKKWEELLKELE